MPRVGLSNFHYAILSKEDATGATYETPVSIPGIREADIKIGSSSDTLYADDGPMDTATVLGEISLSIEMRDLDLATQAALLGHKIVNGVLVSNADDTAPYVAVAFESKKADGKKYYVKLLKGMFKEPDENFKTKDNKVNFQTKKLEGNFVMRTSDHNWKYTADEGDSSYVAGIGANWYKSIEATA